MGWERRVEGRGEGKKEGEREGLVMGEWRGGSLSSLGVLWVSSSSASYVILKQQICTLVYIVNM